VIVNTAKAGASRSPGLQQSLLPRKSIILQRATTQAGHPGPLLALPLPEAEKRRNETAQVSN